MRDAASHSGGGRGRAVRVPGCRSRGGLFFPKGGTRRGLFEPRCAGSTIQLYTTATRASALFRRGHHDRRYSRLVDRWTYTCAGVCVVVALYLICVCNVSNKRVFFGPDAKDLRVYELTTDTEFRRGNAAIMRRHHEAITMRKRSDLTASPACGDIHSPAPSRASQMGGSCYSMGMGHDVTRRVK
eukprot:5331682-Prymnesium_polylepis.1